MTKLFLFLAPLLIGMGRGLPSHAENHWVGNGGHLIRCQGEWLFLDSALARALEQQDGGLQHLSAESFTKNYKKVRDRLGQISTEYQNRWILFVRSWLHRDRTPTERYPGLRIKWIGVPNLHDSDRIVEPPTLSSMEEQAVKEFCGEENLELRLAFAAEETGPLLSKVRRYFYTPDTLRILESSGAGTGSELSWALVHEWLWTVIPYDNADRERWVREMNRSLHLDY